MPESTLKEIFPKPWGILEEYREEVELGAYGTGAKCIKAAMRKKFLNAKIVAAKEGKSVSTIRRKLKDGDARYMVIQRKRCYFIEDINEILTQKTEEA